jgi:spermidine synthase
MTPSHRLDQVRLFFLGFLTLFLELILIRYLAGNIWNLGYFPNLVLLGVFVGMGTGFVLHHFVSDQKSARVFTLSSLLLLALIIFVTFAHPPVPGFLGQAGDFGGDLYFTISPSRPQIVSQAMFVIWFSFVIAIFFTISQATAKVFRRLAPLEAYTLDIAGSCVGILAFMLISWLKLPGFLWFLMLIPVYLASAPLPERRHRWAIAASLLVIAGLAKYQDTRLLATYFSKHHYTGKVDVTWSPYQKVEYFDAPDMRHRIHVNGLGHQQMEGAEAIQNAFYQIPYDRRNAEQERPPIRSVLVIGAGTGNDVASALLNGATHVDAVEIDPVIAELGKMHHPESPYLDPRVELTIDDGRAFMVRTKRRYDLIIFALTDSLVKVSPMAQLRLENYLFTQESVKRAFDLLNTGGDLVLYNFYRRDWLVHKIERMLYDATGRSAKRLFQKEDFVMLNVSTTDPAGTLTAEQSAIAAPNDNWPFLYLKERGIPTIYLYAIFGVLALILSMMAFFQSMSKRMDQESRITTPVSVKVSFLFMGIAFMLLETKSVIQFSLLFGTTWVNNSLVFLSVLLSVLVANWAALRFKRSHLPMIYALLIASCLAGYFYPLGNLLSIENPVSRFGAASLMTFSPIFFANLIFSLIFRNQKTAEHVFGWNLIGATLGGVIEYTSMALGYNALSLVVAICYTVVLIAFAFSTRRRASPPTVEELELNPA